jgi:hypothetical protein
MPRTVRSMEKWSYTKVSKRGRNYILFVVALLVLYIILPARTPPPIPQMPGTYQYFSETDFYSKSHRFGAVSHCDTRFAPKEQPSDDETRQTLQALLESYISTMNELSVSTWLAHGPLIGWYWNRKLLPWDTDIDVHVSGEGIQVLAQSFNMTKYSYPVPPGRTARTYLLDINPHYSIVSEKDVANKIDGRWIDTSNGKFIDITAVHHHSRDGDGRTVPGFLFCKDGHRYKVFVTLINSHCVTGADILTGRRCVSVTTINFRRCCRQRSHQR